MRPMDYVNVINATIGAAIGALVKEFAPQIKDLVTGQARTNIDLYARHTKIWMKRYGTGSGSDRVVLWDARFTGARSLPLPVPYRRALPSTPHLGVPLI
jgi:hypothetical protein